MIPRYIIGIPERRAFFALGAMHCRCGYPISQDRWARNPAITPDTATTFLLSWWGRTENDWSMRCIFRSTACGKGCSNYSFEVPLFAMKTAAKRNRRNVKSPSLLSLTIPWSGKRSKCRNEKPRTRRGFLNWARFITALWRVATGAGETPDIKDAIPYIRSVHIN